MFKKALFSLLAFLLLFQSTVSPVMAQGNQWYDSNILTWFVKVYDGENHQEIFGERYTAAQVQWVVYSLMVLPMNMIFDSSFTACWLKSVDSGTDVWLCLVNPVVIERFMDLLNFIRALSPVIPYGAQSVDPIAETGNQSLLSLIFADRPISGISYFRSMANRANLVPEVHAQPSPGFGYQHLKMLQPLWVQSRDFAYSLLILAAIIMSFMIMFRTKVGPQTVITVQSAIPKLIAAIILITFSYAIAGLLIDLMYVVIGMIAAIMTPGGVEETYQMLTGGPGGGGLIGVMYAYSTLLPYFLSASITAALPDLSGGWGWVVTLMVILLMVVLVFVLFFTFIKILVMLIRAMVTLFLLIIFGPFYILGGAVTSSLGVGSWIKDMIANLAVFPATGLMLLFSFIFLRAAVGPGSTSFNYIPSEELKQVLMELWTGMFGSWSGAVSVTDAESWAPPFLGFGGDSGPMLLMLVSISILTLIPKLSDIIKGFMTGRPFAYGTAIGESFTQGAVAGAGLAKGGWAIGGELRKRSAAKALKNATS